MGTIVQTILLISVMGIIWSTLRPTITMKNKKEIGVARASAIYTDEKGTKMLVAEALDLQGKPDFIFETWFLKKYIPLEIKSGKLLEEEPHLGDVYQLVAYFLLIEAVYDKRPPYGKLVYANKTFKIRNTHKLRNELKKTMTQMRAMLEGDYEPFVQSSYIKCKNCVCKDTVCEFYEGGKNDEKE